MASLLFFLATIITDLILPSFEFFKLPYLCPLFFFLYIGAACYALVKYRFLSFSKKDITQEIFSHVQDMILILNQEKVIIEANNNFNIVCSKTLKDIANRKFEDLIVYDKILSEKFGELVSGKISSFNERIFYKAEQENIAADSYVSRIVDKFNDFVAILIVSRENQELKHFRKQYGITVRQLEIIQLTLDGMSNDEIGEKLSLTRRTVETHLFNIYNKLSIKNKLELMRLANDFNIAAKN